MFGTFIKSAKKFAKKNQLVSTFFAKNYPKWMAVGAIGGAGMGLMDNVIGEDRVSVLGGAIKGATWGAAARGGQQLWSARGSIASKIAGARGRVGAGMKGPKGPKSWTSGAGI